MWTYFVGDLSGILALAVQKKLCDHECDFFLRSVVHTLNHTFCSSNHTSKKCDECKVWTCDLKVWITKNIKGDHMCDNTYKCVI